MAKRKVFVLIKRKGSKRFLGAIPVKAGSSIKILRQRLTKKINKAFMFKIVTFSQLKNVVQKQVPVSRRLRIKRRLKQRRRKKR